ncbi:hypothetical protein H4R20_003699, partial [Coemansia guatemalensis]
TVELLVETEDYETVSWRLNSKGWTTIEAPEPFYVAPATAHYLEPNEVTMTTRWIKEASNSAGGVAPEFYRRLVEEVHKTMEAATAFVAQNTFHTQSRTPKLGAWIEAGKQRQPASHQDVHTGAPLVPGRFSLLAKDNRNVLAQRENERELQNNTEDVDMEEDNISQVNSVTGAETHN